MDEGALLSKLQAQEILRDAGVSGLVRVTEISRPNHVNRLACGDGAFFLEGYTKDWYAADPEAPRWYVAHEQSAWDCLATHGLHRCRGGA